MVLMKSTPYVQVVINYDIPSVSHLIKPLIYGYYADKCFGEYNGGCRDLNRECRDSEPLFRNCGDCLEGYYQVMGVEACVGEYRETCDIQIEIPIRPSTEYSFYPVAGAQLINDELVT